MDSVFIHSSCHSVHVYSRKQNQRRQLQPVATFSQVKPNLCYEDLYGSPVTLQYGTDFIEMSADFQTPLVGSLLMSVLMSGKCGILLKHT